MDNELKQYMISQINYRDYERISYEDWMGKREYLKGITSTVYVGSKDIADIIYILSSHHYVHPKMILHSFDRTKIECLGQFYGVSYVHISDLDPNDKHLYYIKDKICDDELRNDQKSDITPTQEKKISEKLKKYLKKVWWSQK